MTSCRNDSMIYAALLLNLLFSVAVFILMIPIVTLVYNFYKAFKERNKMLRDKDIAVVKVERKLNTRPPAINRQTDAKERGQQRLSEIIHPIHFVSKTTRRQQQKKKAGRFRRSLSFSLKRKQWDILPENEELSLEQYHNQPPRCAAYSTVPTPHTEHNNVMTCNNQRPDTVYVNQPQASRFNQSPDSTVNQSPDSKVNQSKDSRVDQSQDSRVNQPQDSSNQPQHNRVKISNTTASYAINKDTVTALNEDPELKVSADQHESKLI